ncbi:MAG TPA: DUF885 domain-containing protein [Candidatus Saccharimonadales bacterium]|nr:DUF885 domain-containing protein [Candidatus Saccharimonadales bacterium]
MRHPFLAGILLFCLGEVKALPAFTNDPTAELHNLLKSEWDYTMEQSPSWASQLGDRRWNDRWEDLSFGAFEKRYKHVFQVLNVLNKIPRTQLSPANQLNYDLYKREQELAKDEYPFKWYVAPVNQREGIQLADELADALRFETTQDYEDWITRMRSFTKYMDQTIALMKEGMRLRIVQPRVVMQRLPGQIEKQIVALPQASPFFKPFRSFPPTISAEETNRLVKAAREAIEESVIPSYRSLKEFFTTEYLPACFDKPGAWQLPNGKELYSFMARKFTTTKMTPEQIHELGLAEVKRIRGEMEQVKETVGFKGTLEEFFHYLRTDPRFSYKTTNELLSAYRSMAKQIDPSLLKLFRTLPRIPYGVEPIPDKIAPDTTAAYYRQPASDGSRAGTFFVNLYKPETRYKYEIPALSLHESVPGHHFQIALAMEQGELPNFRRYGELTAFVEGWGLYAESLGTELGFYQDPYDKFGQLTYEMWRAVRLVVDTGIHYYKWDRQKAIEYFKNNAAKGENDIINEVDRYITWPGQALAYKIGELKIKELRARSEKELTDKFDVREFHDVILLGGSLPLEVLEKRVMDWLHVHNH